MLWILKYQKKIGVDFRWKPLQQRQKKLRANISGGGLIDVEKAMEKIDYYLEQQEVE